MIEIRRLTKQYGDKTAVDDLSFIAPPGKVTGFLGSNGAGKSTTMRLIVGLDASTLGLIGDTGRQAMDELRRVLGVLRESPECDGPRSPHDVPGQIPIRSRSAAPGSELGLSLGGSGRSGLCRRPAPSTPWPRSHGRRTKADL